MGTSKWRGGVGLTYTATASAEDTPVIWPRCESANLAGEPILYEGVNQIDPDVFALEEAGHEFAWNIDGMEPNCKEFGYLWWLFLGGDAWSTDHHDVTPADAQQYACISVDRVLDLGTSTPTEVGVGAKTGSIALEINSKAFWKMTVSGIYCAKGTDAATLTPVIPTAAAEAPLSWASLCNASGYFKMGYAGAATTQVVSLQNFKMTGTQTMKGLGVALGTAGSPQDQPTSVGEFKRELTIEVTQELTGTHAQDQFSAWEAGNVVEIEFKAVVGTSSVTVSIPNIRVSGSYAEPIGASEDALLGILKGRAFVSGSDLLVDMDIIDGTSAAYNTL